MKSISRMRWLAALCCACSCAQAKQPALVLDEITISDLQQRLRTGELTSHTLVQHYLDRIAAIDKTGPAINAVIERTGV